MRAIYVDKSRVATPEGHARTLAVHVLGALHVDRVDQRAVEVDLPEQRHDRSGDTSLRDIDWTARRWDGTQAYCDSKLFITTFAFALARRWPDRCVNAVNPGWVPTRMGGPAGPDDLDLGHVTQTWLAVSEESEATGTAGYWYHQRREPPAQAAADHTFQDSLIEQLNALTGVRLP